MIAVGFTVLCGAFAGTASAAVPGLQLATTTSADNSFFVKEAIAFCPAGKKLIGTGGQLTVRHPYGRVFRISQSASATG